MIRRFGRKQRLKMAEFCHSNIFYKTNHELSQQACEGLVDQYLYLVSRRFKEIRDGDISKWPQKLSDELLNFCLWKASLTGSFTDRAFTERSHSSQGESTNPWTTKEIQNKIQTACRYGLKIKNACRAKEKHGKTCRCRNKPQEAA